MKLLAVLFLTACVSDANVKTQQEDFDSTIAIGSVEPSPPRAHAGGLMYVEVGKYWKTTKRNYDKKWKEATTNCLPKVMVPIVDDFRDFKSKAAVQKEKTLILEYGCKP